MAKPGLSIVMIARDERDNLAALLPMITGEADDIIVVDTGSQDGTREKAAELGARVFEHPWNDDFAEARNRGLEEVETSHVLWLDADDRFEANDVRRVREQVLAKPDRGFMLLLVNESLDPSGISSCWQLRVFPARPEHRFEGRIHEQIQENLNRTGTVVEKLDLTVRHTGYLSNEDVVRKSRRNLELLELEMAQGKADDISVLYHYVRSASRCGELDKAAEAARRCLDTVGPDSPMELVQSCAVTLARVEYQRGHRLEAVKVMAEAVERVPGDALARFAYGDMLRQMGDFSGAIRELQAARLSPIKQTTFPIPVAGLHRAIRLQLGEIFEVLSQPDRAVPVFRELLEQQPDDRSGRRALARALLGTGELDEAGAALAELEDGEEEVEVRLLRATHAFLSGSDERATELFQEAERLSPHVWAAALHQGHISLRNGRFEEARANYERACSKADNPETRVGLAAVLLETGHLNEALENLVNAVDASEKRPLPPGTEALCGEALLRLGRPEQARNAFENHMKRHGADPRIVSRLADCYRELGAPDAAKLGYEEALRLQPGLTEAERGLQTLGAGV